MKTRVLFALALVGWWRSRAHPITGLLAAILLLNTALIGFTYDEWNGRFLVPLWPVLLAWSVIGTHELINRLGPEPR